MLKKRAKHAKVDSLSLTHFFSFFDSHCHGILCTTYYSRQKSYLVCEAFSSSKPSILIPRLMAFLCSSSQDLLRFSKEKNANLWEMSSSSSTPPNSQCLKVTNNVSFELSKKKFLMSRKAKKLVEFCLHFSKVVQISLQFDIFFDKNQFQL